MTLHSLTHDTCSRISHYSGVFTQGVQNLTDTRIYALGKALFLLGQGWFMAGYGVREWYVDGVKQRERLKEQERVNQQVSYSVKGFYDRIHSWQMSLASFSKRHGAFFMVTGVTGGISALHEFNFIDLGWMKFPVDFSCQLSFILANVEALNYNRNPYQRAQTIEKQHHSPEQKKLAHHLKISAVSGIISSINYLIAALVSLFGAPFAMALLFGCIGVFFGAFKILYDFLYVDGDQALVSAKNG